MTEPPTPTSILPGAPSYDLQAHLAYVRELHAKYEINTPEKAHEWTLKILSRIYDGREPDQLLKPLYACIHELFEQERLYAYTAPTLEERQYLTRRQAELASSDRLEKATFAIIDLLKGLPHFPTAQSGPIVPLSALLPNYAVRVHLTMSALLDCKLGNERVFSLTAYQLITNTQRASGIHPDKPSTRSIINPSEYDGDPNDYFSNTPFETLFTVPVPFVIPREKYCEHSLIVAASGSGKTQYLQSLVLNFLQEPDPPGMFILDSQDDEDGILHKLSRLQLFSDRLKDRLIILSPDDKPSLNLFAFTDDSAETDELFSYLAGAIDRELTAKMSTASAYILRLLRAIDAPTIHTFKDILENPKRYQKEIASLDQTAQDFFNNQFNVKSEMGATRLQVASRLYTILANRAFTDMFAAKENRFDVYEAMRQKKIVLVNTSERKLGSAGSRIFGRYIVAQVMAAAMKRGDTSANRELSLLLLDEAHEYFDAQTEKILRQARKFNVGLVAATQMYDQTETKVKAALATNTATKMVGSVSHNDARDLAQEMFTTTEHIRAMKKGQFATYVRDLTSRAITLNIPFGAVEAEPQMSEDAYQQMRERNRAALSTRYASIVSTEASNVRAHLPTAGMATNLAPSTTETAAEFEIKPGKDW